MYVNGYGKSFKDAARGLRSMDQYDDSAYGLFVREYFAIFADGIGDSLSPRGVEKTFKSGKAHFEAGFTAFYEGRYLDGALQLGGGTFSGVSMGLILTPIGRLEGGLTRALEGSVGAMTESAAVSEIRALANAADKAAAQRAYVLGNIAENRTATQTIAGGLAKMESRAVSVVENGEHGVKTFYHGTDMRGAANIRMRGIDLSKSRIDLDFGKGFYVTENYEQATLMARRTARRLGSTPEVLSFQVKPSELNLLSKKIFDSADLEFVDFAKRNRNLAPLHDFDIVTGPVIRNLKTFDAFPYPFWNQTSIHTEGALKLFNSGLIQ